MKNDNEILITGNEAAVMAAVDAGAEIMFGYPITPATEILQGWIKESRSNKNLQFLQTEDETSAGFGVIGALLAGKKAFTASAGPGHILMQDPLAMAENLRLPFVSIMMQRGGPSTGTVNFSQQEVNLACFGGNGDGLKVVYSASTVEEMYTLTYKSFSTAWKFRFPTTVLGDGYLAKTKNNFKIRKMVKSVASEKILKEQKTPTHLRNCYSSEPELFEKLKKNIADWNLSKNRISESENYLTQDANEIILAHGIVASACKEAVNIMRDSRRKIGLFRPVTLNPFDQTSLLKTIKKAKRIYLFESSLNQFSRIVKYEIYGRSTPIVEFPKPAVGFTPSEIINLIKSK